jgi:hypothetical protein
MNIAQRMLNEMVKGGLQKKDVAKLVGVSPAFIGAVLDGRKLPGPKILHYLGLEAYQTYRRVGPSRAPRPAQAAPTTPSTP